MGRAARAVAGCAVPPPPRHCQRVLRIRHHRRCRHWRMARCCRRAPAGGRQHHRGRLEGTFLLRRGQRMVRSTALARRVELMRSAVGMEISSPRHRRPRLSASLTRMHAAALKEIWSAPPTPSLPPPRQCQAECYQGVPSHRGPAPPHPLRGHRDAFVCYLSSSAPAGAFWAHRRGTAARRRCTRTVGSEEQRRGRRRRGTLPRPRRR